MSCSLRKKNQGFLNCLFCPKDIFLASVFNLNVVYWIHFQNIRTSTYQKTLLDKLFCLFYEKKLYSQGSLLKFFKVQRASQNIYLCVLRWYMIRWVSLKFLSILVVFSLWCKNISGLSQIGKAWKCVISQSDSRLW